MGDARTPPKVAGHDGEGVGDLVHSIAIFRKYSMLQDIGERSKRPGNGVTLFKQGLQLLLLT